MRLWGLIGGVCGALWGPSSALWGVKGLWEVQRDQKGIGGCVESLGGWRGGYEISRVSGESGGLEVWVSALEGL